MFRRYIYKNAFFYTYHEKNKKKYFADIKNNYIFAMSKRCGEFRKTLKAKKNDTN